MRHDLLMLNRYVQSIQKWDFIDENIQWKWKFFFLFFFSKLTHKINYEIIDHFYAIAISFKVNDDCIRMKP